MASGSNQERTTRPSWTGPIIVIASGVLGIVVFGSLAYYRIAYGWPGDVSESDESVMVVASDVEPFLADLAIRQDQEQWSKTFFPGERCQISYVYAHPDSERELRIESYVYTETTRKHSFEKWKMLVATYQSRFAALVPDAKFMNRDKEFRMSDQSRFGSFNVGDRPIAYFFARRRGKHLFFGFVQSSELDDGRIGEIFDDPSTQMTEWTPTP
jgi:hypothetical protein